MSSETGNSRQLAVQDVADADLVEVVVLRVHPEDRHDRGVVLRGEPAREPYRGERLEQREERAAEQTCLLPGDHRHRAPVAQARAAAARDAAGASRGRELPCDDVGGRGVRPAAPPGLRSQPVQLVELDGDPAKYGTSRSNAWQ